MGRKVCILFCGPAVQLDHLQWFREQGSMYALDAFNAGTAIGAWLSWLLVFSGMGTYYRILYFDEPIEHSSERKQKITPNRRADFLWYFTVHST